MSIASAKLVSITRSKSMRFPSLGPGVISSSPSDAAGTSSGFTRSRSPVARATSVPSLNSADSISCTFLPGRIVRVRTEIRLSGTGRSNSIVTRATCIAGSGS